MTMEILSKIIEENNIPKDVHFISDSGWECDATEMDGVFYNRKSNTIVFTQGACTERDYEQSDEWEILYAPELIKINELEVYPVTNPVSYDGMTEEFKKEIKAAGDFEQYYGIKETNGAYDGIDLRRPLFYCIKIKGDFIGYIGFNGYDESVLEPEIYIFKQYRNKGYGTCVLKRFIDIAFKEGLIKEWRIGDKSWKKKTILPTTITSTVRVENEYSRKMMKSCGFTEDNATTTNLVAFVDEDDEVDYGFVKVVNYHITKEQYLQGHLS